MQSAMEKAMAEAMKKKVTDLEQKLKVQREEAAKSKRLDDFDAFSF